MNIPKVINPEHFNEVLGNAFKNAKSVKELTDEERLALMAYLELLSEDDSGAKLRGMVRASLGVPFALGQYLEIYQEVKTKFYKKL